MIITMGYGSKTTTVRMVNMSVTRKNLRYCQVLEAGVYYDIMIAVDDLDEVDNILQNWALEELSTTLDLPEALILNKDITEVLTSLSIDNFAYIQSAVSAYMEVPRFAGVSGTFPTLPTALVAALYVMPEIKAFLYSTATFGGYFGEYTVPTASFSLSAGVNFIGVTFNSGTPIYALYNSDASFDYSSIIPVAAVLYFGGTIYNIPYGQMGYGLPEKLTEIMKKRQEFDIVSTFTLAMSVLYIELGALTLNRGTAEIACLAVDTEEANNDMFLNYFDGSLVWQTSSVTQINNTQYQNPAGGLSALVGGEFVINYIYRVADSVEKIVFTALSNKFASLALAKESENITNLSDMINESAVLVGRVIVEQGSSTTVVQKVQNQWFGTSV